MATTITYNAEGEPGYQWVVRTEITGVVGTICFATQWEAEHYVMICVLSGEEP